MQFKDVMLSQAEGWRLAHSMQSGGKRLAKGTVITARLAAELEASGHTSAYAFLLDDGDLDENTAAEQIAHHIAGANLTVGKASRGRCNLFAAEDGLFLAGDGINQLNATDSAVGVATLPDYAPVSAGKLVATIKIVPYGIGSQQVEQICQIPEKATLHPFYSFKAVLMVSGHTISDRVLHTTQSRLEAIKGHLSEPTTCAHTLSAVTSALKSLASTDANLILLSGISAISDRRDVLPAALKDAGGELLHLGMPVDPGNLLMLGTIQGKTVIGIPGCAKSPSLNGFDWVLERFAANLPLNKSTIQEMGVGGLLKETSERPVPRAPGENMPITKTAAIVLAAGRSSRSGSTHKLLAKIEDKTVVERSLECLLKAGIQDLIVVTGAKHEEMTTILQDYPVRVVENTGYAAGMSTSIAAGLAALPDGCPQCIITLADMPFVSTRTHLSLIDGAQRVSEADIFVPVFNNKRGNPVLWRQSQFEKLAALDGDKGGRALFQGQENSICEIPVDDPAIFIDLDTPEALAQFGITAAD